MPEYDNFPFAQQEVARAPVYRAPDASPATPQQTGMAAVAPGGPSAPAVPAAGGVPARSDRPEIPSWSENPLGRIAFVLESIGAGMQGRELPVQRVQRMQQQYDQTERAQVATGIQGLTLGLGLLQNVPEDQRQTFTERYGRMLDRLSPGMAGLFGQVASQPDARELARAFGEHADVLMPFVRGMPPAQAWETARSIISNRQLMDHVEAQADRTNRPAVIARLEAIRGAVQAGVSTGALPADAGRRAQGIDPEVMADTIIGRESGGNPNARSPTSSATGPGQFTDATWLGTREAPGVAARAGVPQDVLERAWAGDADARRQALDARTDPQIARRGVLAYMGQNATALTRAGIELTPTNLYLMGFGEGNALPLIRAARQNPDTPVDQVVRADAYRANQAVFARDGRPRTAGEVVADIDRDITQRYGRAVAATGQAMSLPQMEALNSRLPPQFRMTPSEMGTLRRSPDLMLSAGIVPPGLQADMAQGRARQQIAQDGERPELREIVENGRRFFIGIDRAGNITQRIPAGDLQGTSEFERLARVPPEQRTPEQTARIQSLLRGAPGMSVTLPDGTTVQYGNTANQENPRAQEYAQLRSSDSAGEEASRLIGRMQQQLNQPGGVTTGLVGTGVRAVNAIADQLSQLTETLNPQQRALLDVSRYASLLPQVSVGSAEESARFRTNLVTLAYAVARARDPRGQVTERDIQRTLSSLGTGEMLSSRDQMRAALDETLRGLREGYRTRHEGLMRDAPERERRDVPAWARDPAPGGSAAGAAPGAAVTMPRTARDVARMSDAELQALPPDRLNELPGDVLRAAIDRLNAANRQQRRE